MAIPSNSPLLPTVDHVDACAAAKLVVCSTDLAGSRACATVKIGARPRVREFMLGNSRMKLPDVGRRGQFEGVADSLATLPLWV